MEELVVRAKNGDEKAYTQLMLAIKNDLYKICKTRIASDDDIDDIIQDTMIQTFKSIKKLKDNTKFKSWIVTILINNCNKLYKEKQKIKLITNKFSYKQNDREILIENNMIKSEDDMNFYQLLDHLKYEEKVVIILYYSEKFKINEISKILHINENTVKTRIYRAKEKIKEKIKEG